MKLSDVFLAVAHKQLALVDLPNVGSNQHELNGIAALKQLFGTEASTTGVINWHYFADDEEPQAQSGDFTFYDARKRSSIRTGRSEWRFYYTGEFLSRASVGDILVIARSLDGRYHGLVFQAWSSWSRAAEELWGMGESQLSFDLIAESELEARQLAFQREQILLELDLDVKLPVAPTDEDLIVQKFGKKFPPTKQMSDFAREQTPSDTTGADEKLLLWLEREEQLFRALENVIVSERLTESFGKVQDFIDYSLSVQNRRKARMGHALQNHLGELFTQNKLMFTPQASTEGSNKPDFIFPGVAEYHDKTFDSKRLVMLGAKSTSKDRWRQVLTEADRISQKHLCTLEPGISEKQTDEMRRQSLTLVVPAQLQRTYTAKQRNHMLSLSAFISFVSEKQ
jgi:hypothetical protein